MRRLAESIVAAEETARILAAAFRPPEIEGVIQPLSLDVTPERPVLLRPLRPWWSVYVLNDGPDVVHVYVNRGERSFDLGKYEDKGIDMGAPRIEEVLIEVDEGCSASVRVDAKR